MLKPPPSDKDNYNKNKDNGKTLKFNKRKKIKLWKFKDLKKLKNNKKSNNSKKYKPSKERKSSSIK